MEAAEDYGEFRIDPDGAESLLPPRQLRLVSAFFFFNVSGQIRGRGEQVIDDIEELHRRLCPSADVSGIGEYAFGVGAEVYCREDAAPADHF